MARKKQRRLKAKKIMANLVVNKIKSPHERKDVAQFLKRTAAQIASGQTTNNMFRAALKYY